MTPRRNPDIVVAVLWEHGYWGNNSAKLAAGIINTFVTKQRKRDNNIHIADTPKPETPSPTPTTPTASTTRSAPPTAE
jgi:penicillin-binding protein 2